jgi:hypothetical protein
VGLSVELQVFKDLRGEVGAIALGRFPCPVPPLVPSPFSPKREKGRYGGTIGVSCRISCRWYALHLLGFPRAAYRLSCARYERHDWGLSYRGVRYANMLADGLPSGGGDSPFSERFFDELVALELLKAPLNCSLGFAAGSGGEGALRRARFLDQRPE